MARYEIVTGVERQRHWSDGEKLSILREAFQPGLLLQLLPGGMMSAFSRSTIGVKSLLWPRLILFSCRFPCSMMGYWATAS